MTDAGYEYEVPTTSPFYRYYLSPFCDRVVEYIPEVVQPDTITWIGLGCAVCAIICLPVSPLLTAMLWVLYGIADNLDGKQARRTKQASVRGEFLDHSVDSATCSLLCYVLAYGFLGSKDSYLLINLATQIPFLLGCWYYNVTGKVLLGCSRSGKAPVVTVDEINLICVPLVILCRSVLALPILGTWTIGYFVMCLCVLGCCFEGFSVIKQVLELNSFNKGAQVMNVAAGLIYVVLVAVCNLQPIVTLPVFIWLCSCLILPHCYVKRSSKARLLDCQTNVIWPTAASLLLAASSLGLKTQFMVIRIALNVVAMFVMALDLLALS